jgi:hypothetical protein
MEHMSEVPYVVRPDSMLIPTRNAAWLLKNTLAVSSPACDQVGRWENKLIVVSLWDWIRDKQEMQYDCGQKTH